ncbi:SRPBCC family protein [Pontimicrobium sp. SW4]|uniref:SRPBCC family protein n=1 Tax=Pontimicrobium sp. SW4 TaxID=3153519 RepID=A0AAU7BV60_9FLAO
MKFTCSIAVNKPRDLVVEYFSNPKYLKEYQEGFIRKEFVSGNEGQNGAISKMYYKMGKGQMELTETITNNNLPDSFAAQYHHKHTDNTMLCTFTMIDANTTQCDWEIEYTAFRGFVITILKTLFPGMFKKQVQKWLQNFKDFVEKQN